MLNLEVEVTREPVIEGGGVHIARCNGLGGHPVILLVPIDLHREVVHLGNKGKPMALQEPGMTAFPLSV